MKFLQAPLRERERRYYGKHIDQQDVLVQIENYKQNKQKSPHTIKVGYVEHNHSIKTQKCKARKRIQTICMSDASSTYTDNKAEESTQRKVMRESETLTTTHQYTQVMKIYESSLSVRKGL